MAVWAVKLVNGQVIHVTQSQYLDIVTTCGVAGVLACFLMWWIWSNML